MKLSGKAIAIIVIAAVAFLAFLWLNNAILSWG